jgi:hypothetical protein
MNGRNPGTLTGGAVTLALAILLVPGHARSQGAGGSHDERLQEHVGLKVHGHWIMEVRNPDGTSAQHIEFENALANLGARYLSDVLGRKYSVGEMRVFLNGNACPFNSCMLAEPSNPLQAANVFKTLALSVPTAGPNTGLLVLQGSATAATAGQITDVETDPILCPPVVTPATSCRLGDPGAVAYQLTSHTLTTPVSVAAGQAIQVTVVISFS